MTDWRVEFDREPAKVLRRLSRTDRERIVAAIDRLPDEGDVRELLGGTGLYRLRVGDWRVIFRRLDEVQVLQVVKVRPRGSAYKP